MKGGDGGSGGSAGAVGGIGAPGGMSGRAGTPSSACSSFASVYDVVGATWAVLLHCVQVRNGCGKALRGVEDIGETYPFMRTHCIRYALRKLRDVCGCLTVCAAGGKAHVDSAHACIRHAPQHQLGP